MNAWKHLSKCLWVIVRSKCMLSFNLGKNCQIVLPKKVSVYTSTYMYACPFLIPSLKVFLFAVFMGQFTRGNPISVVLWEFPVTGVYFQLLLIQLYFSSELAIFQLGCLFLSLCSITLWDDHHLYIYCIADEHLACFQL